MTREQFLHVVVALASALLVLTFLMWAFPIRAQDQGYFTTPTGITVWTPDGGYSAQQRSITVWTPESGYTASPNSFGAWTGSPPPLVPLVPSGGEQPIVVQPGGPPYYDPAE